MGGREEGEKGMKIHEERRGGVRVQEGGRRVCVSESVMGVNDDHVSE